MTRVLAAALLIVLCCVAAEVIAAKAPAGEGAGQSELVFGGPDGKLQYKPDQQGNTIPDFSNCGYRGGGVAIQDVPVRRTLLPIAESTDDTARVQQAIDDVSKLTPDAAGFRGAVLLKRGTYRIPGRLTIAASGVVLRGEGDGEGGTVLIAAGKTQRILIDVKGTSAAREEQKSRRKIADAYVPVGARSFSVDDASAFKPGDTVIVTRVGNAAWISAIGMDRIKGRPGNESSTKQWTPFDLAFDRVVTAVSGNSITIDAPITCAIEQKWGGGTIGKSSDDGRIEQVGVESLRAVSEYDKSITAEHQGRKYASDDDHALYLVSFINVKNAWGRKLTSVHFYHGPADIGEGSKWVTVEDARSLEPVSALTGGRRYPYRFGGQLGLFQRCYSKGARHAFVVHARICGPNAFVDCESEEDYATSEPHHRWSVGGLYDNVKSRIAFQDRQWMGSGHGWSGANYVAWNCEGTLVCQHPPTAQNWSIGFVGKKEKGAFDRPDGVWESFGRHVQPPSLYRKQLEDRLGSSATVSSSTKAVQAVGVK